ncbi:MAG: arginine--tRNA ligase [archaeon]
MWDDFKAEVKKEVNFALKELDASLSIDSFEQPPGGFGDLSTTAPLVLAKELGRKPRDIAKDMLDIISTRKHKLISKVEVAGPGYLNFYLDYDKSAGVLIADVLKKKDNYGKSAVGKKKKTLVEHTSANPDGPLHVGHFRNSVIGDCLARLLNFGGYDASTEFYVNDGGRQMGVCLWSYMNFHAGEKPDGKKDHWVAKVYIDGNKRLEGNEEGEKQVAQLLLDYAAGKHQETWSKVVDWCLEGHKQTLEGLGISVDAYHKESREVWDGSVKKMIKLVEKSKNALKDGELLGMDLKEHGFEKEFLVRRSDGTILYGAKDLAYHFFHKAGQADWMINVLGSDHKLYYGQLRTALNLLGVKQKFDVVHYEFLTLPEGQMSTRRGTYIAVDDLIAEARKRALAEVKKRRSDLSEKEMLKIADGVAVGALRYSIASISPEKPIFFKWEDALNFDKSSAPALQYTFARTTRILEKSKEKPDPKVKSLEESEKMLVRKIARFQETVEKAASELRPHVIANYADELNTAFKDFYAKCQVIGSDKEAQRLAIVKAVNQVMKNCLNILGIEPLAVM